MDTPETRADLLVLALAQSRKSEWMVVPRSMMLVPVARRAATAAMVARATEAEVEAFTSPVLLRQAPCSRWVRFRAEWAVMTVAQVSDHQIMEVGDVVSV